MSISSNNSARGRAPILVFCALSWLCIVVTFRGAISGSSILVPLDIPAIMYGNYRFIDPNLGPVPRNHSFIDLFDYDVPRVYRAHEAMRAGEFPWWDPYSDGGRPLIAEAHTAIADPIRFLMLEALPFVPAYNWAHIVQSFVTGLGIFLLLRSFGASAFVTILGALSFQFCGQEAVRFYPENVPSSLAWYPFLWLALSSFQENRPFRAIALGGAICAGIFFSGNPQSHAYLVFFLGCFCLAYGGFDRRALFRVSAICLCALTLGAALAAPILGPQVELYLSAKRNLESSNLQIVTGLVSTLSVFPWFSGTHRSIDPAKLVGANGAAFALWLGTPVMILCLTALLNWRRIGLWKAPHTRMGILLLITYLVVICSTPLIRLLYIRAAGLGILGVVVLFGSGLELLLQRDPIAQRHLKRILAVIGVGVLLVHVFAFLLFPKIEGKVTQFIVGRSAENLGVRASALRVFQVHNLPNEITFKNPELAAAFLGAIALLFIASSSFNLRRLAIAIVCLGNVLSLLLFFNRFIPNFPAAYWERLLQGGPEQQRAIALLGRDLRLEERGNFAKEFIFPGVTACYYKVHTLTGYSSFPLTGPGQGGSPRSANVVATISSNAPPTLEKLSDGIQTRFAWKNDAERRVKILDESLNTIRLQIDQGPPGDLIRYDTYYPGWRVKAGEGVRQFRDASGFWAFSIPAAATELRLHYAPSHLNIFQALSGGAALTIVTLLIMSGAKSRLVSVNSLS